MSHLATPRCALHRGTGQWRERAEIWPRSLQKPSPQARQREMHCSHSASAHQGFCLPGLRGGGRGATPSFQKGTIRVGGILRLWLRAASVHSGASSKAAATADWDGGTSSTVTSAPSLPLDHHALVQRHPAPSLRGSAFLLPPSPSAPPSQRGPFTSESGKPARLLGRGANTSQNVFWGNTGC